jgi:hypothetical protein
MSRPTCRSVLKRRRSVDRHFGDRLRRTIFAASTLEACANVATIICRHIGIDARISHFRGVSLGAKSICLAQGEAFGATALLVSFRRCLRSPGAPASAAHTPIGSAGPGSPFKERVVNFIVEEAAERAGGNPAASIHWSRHAHASHAIDWRANHAGVGHLGACRPEDPLSGAPNDAGAKPRLDAFLDTLRGLGGLYVGRILKG